MIVEVNMENKEFKERELNKGERKQCYQKKKIKFYL